MVRLVPDIPFPPYTFFPGCPHPHPEHPGGHSYGKQRRQPDPLDPARWWECRTYLYGIDLFNGPVPGGRTGEFQPESPGGSSGYYWEAHEAWEGLWHACGRRGVLADFLKGLIKLAAAGVKHREGKPEGVRSHTRRAAELWRDIARSPQAGQAPFLGLRIPELVAAAEGIYRHGWPAEPPVLVLIFSRE